MDSGGSIKRGRPASALNGKSTFKKSKQEADSLQTGIGSKTKPCTKFFSMTGCAFGEGCHFAHYVPGGMKAVSQMTGGSNPAFPAPARSSFSAPSFPDRSSPSIVKTRLCNKFNTPEGCKFGDKCNFAHGERELAKSSAPSHQDSYSGGRFGGRADPSPQTQGGAAASFGASATAKISVDGSLAGAIIGKSGVNSKHICHASGVKLSIKDHESDPKLKNIELEGTFDQIKQASQMVRELIVNISSGVTAPPPQRNPSGPGGSRPAHNMKTKLCDNFTNGTCTFGDRCHFAHGAEELRKSGVSAL